MLKELVIGITITLVLLVLTRTLDLPSRAGIPVGLAFFLGVVWRTFIDRNLAKEKEEEDVPE